MLQLEPAYSRAQQHSIVVGVLREESLKPRLEPVYSRAERRSIDVEGEAKMHVRLRGWGLQRVLLREESQRPQLEPAYLQAQQHSIDVEKVEEVSYLDRHQRLYGWSSLSNEEEETFYLLHLQLLQESKLKIQLMLGQFLMMNEKQEQEHRQLPLLEVDSDQQELLL